jgi:hypothetical protein
MEIIPVTSSNIKGIGYDKSSSTLFVVFHSGGTYQYFNVPEHLYLAFINADSKGKFLHQHVKYQYRYQKVN